MTPVNYNNPAVKRLMREASQMKNPTSEYHAHPLDENIFEWHFTLRGPPDTVYDGGIYHGRILFPNEYPMKPPSIILLTPNGRFEVGKKICLSVSAFHPEEWLPCWDVRTILVALMGFFPTPTEGAVGSTEISDDDRAKLAIMSPNWKCNVCNCINKNILLPEDKAEAEKIISEAKAISSEIHITAPSDTKSEVISTPPSTDTTTPDASTEPVCSEPLNADSQTSPVENAPSSNSPISAIPQLPSSFLRKRRFSLNSKSDGWTFTKVPFMYNSEDDSRGYKTRKIGQNSYVDILLPIYTWNKDEDIPEPESTDPPSTVPEQVNPPIPPQTSDFQLICLIFLGLTLIYLLMLKFKQAIGGLNST